MSDWAALGDRIAHKSQRQQAAEHERRAREQAQHDYELWANRSVQLVMRQLFHSLEARATEFAAATGVGFNLGALRCVQLGDGDAPRVVLSLRLNDDTVDLYAQWSPGTAPGLHLLLSRIRRGRPLRLVCIPGAWLSPAATEPGYELRAFGDAAQVVSAESLVYHAVSLLAME